MSVEAGQTKLPTPTATAPVPEDIHPPTNFAEYIDRLAEISPRAAITEAWRFVEGALTLSVERLGISAPRSNRAMERALASRSDIDPKTISLLADLRSLRNQAVHATEFALNTDQAREFGDLAIRLAGALSNATMQDSDDIG